MKRVVHKVATNASGLSGNAFDAPGVPIVNALKVESKVSSVVALKVPFGVPAGEAFESNVARDAGDASEVASGAPGEDASGAPGVAAFLCSQVCCCW